MTLDMNTSLTSCHSPILWSTPKIQNFTHILSIMTSYRLWIWRHDILNKSNQFSEQIRVFWCVTRRCLIVLSLLPNFDLFHWWWRHYDVIIEKPSSFRKWHSTDLDSSHQIPLGSIIKKHIYLISGFTQKWPFIY